MKILYTATVASHICQFHLPYLKLCKGQGHTVHVAARDNLAEKNGLKLDFAEQVFDIPFQRSPKSPQNLRAYKQLKELIDREHYELIVCNTPMGGIVTRLAARKARRQGARVIYIAHGFHFYKGASKKAWLVFYPIERIMAHLCDTVVTINEEDFKLARGKFPGKVARIHGVGVSRERYHPVDPSARAELRAAEGLSPNDFVILCTGELNGNKDQSTLIRAAAKLSGRIPALRVLLAGNGPMEGQLREMIHDLGLENSVRLMGYRTDLERVVPAADLIVSCSRREGLGLNVIEGMLCEKPVAAAINRGHTELIENGVNGVLFAPGDTEGLAAQIEALWADPESAKIMGQTGLKKAQTYTVDAVLDEMRGILWNTPQTK